ncbi:MAG: bifunctional oligoribonuclease/PAP phosphatase NrnA [Lachnospiraceae bacterium]|nr:bifunctional oligoribonuclease/PAP phosphatase NrnA [Lachnospiraceae bacterium]
MFDFGTMIAGAHSIGIGGHTNPDGDCVGACLGLYNYLLAAYPDKEVTLFMEQPRRIFDYLKGFEDIVTPEKETNPEMVFDAFVALDCGDMSRLGSAEKYLEIARETMCIDHHISNTGFARHALIEPGASSTCEILYGLFQKEYVDAEIAKCIYTGIIHDTGVFQYSNTSKRTFEIAGELVEHGFDFSSIIDFTFYEKTYVQNQIMGRALLESILFLDGNCVFSAIDKRTMDFYNVTGADMEGIVNQLRLTRGVHCAIFMYEKKPMLFKVSLRSDDTVDVARIASSYGGGGHKRAAGFNMSGTVHDIINNISGQIESELKKHECL